MRGKSQLRIVSGTLGGRIIDTPANRGITQPMGERERMAIFNQIRPYLPDAKVLDAFAGSGALGITALSNGAASADFLENNSKAIKTIKMAHVSGGNTTAAHQGRRCNQDICILYWSIICS